MFSFKKSSPQSRTLDPTLPQKHHIPHPTQYLNTIKLICFFVLLPSGGIDAIEEINEDMQEHMDTANEISDIMGQTMGDEFDDEELENELDDLEAEVMEEEMMKQNDEVAQDPFTLPVVPDDPINQPTPMVTEEDDADALAQLKAEMA